MTLASGLPINRQFRELSEAEVVDIDKVSSFARGSWINTFGWDELLRSMRILIVSEAGTGKTYECQAQQSKLWKVGEPAFFLELATLATGSVREMLSAEEEERFEAWHRSQSDIATFFLDSIDELKLTLGTFDQALKRLNKALAGQLGRVRIIITTRPVPIDRELIIRRLPIPEAAKSKATADSFADMVMARGAKQQERDVATKAWRNVGLMPLSREQMRDFASFQGVTDPDMLLADILRRDAEEFAERPQDLIELCTDWREHHRIRSHREQVETNVATKLKPAVERKERAELSQQMAVEGAARLALASMLTRKLTLRYNANADSVHASEAALDVSKILHDWSAEARDALLERSLFGFASYGRVRFHHRSVMEFLAAKRLDALIASGVPIKAIKRILFTTTAQNESTTRPSLRPVAAWLALSCESVFEQLVQLDPAVIFEHGDPQSLRPPQRIRALEAYVERYGRGGWRGLNTPRIQVQRFSSPDLGDTVKRLWERQIENPEVRDLLLQIIAAAKLSACSDLAYAVAMDNALTIGERSLAIRALAQIGDSRLEAIADSIETDQVRWPERAARRAILDLFPNHTSVARLSVVLQRARENSRTIGDLNYRLPREIETVEFSPAYLDQLRRALTELILREVSWEPDQFPSLQTKRSDLVPALIAACRRQASEGVRSDSWVDSTLLAIRLSREDASKELADLRRVLSDLGAEAREVAFWREAALLDRLHPPKDHWRRVYDLTRYGGIQLNDEKDGAWIRRRLSDSSEPLSHREMMLWVEMALLKHSGIEHRSLLQGLKLLVSDAPSLITIIDNRLKPSDRVTAEIRRMEKARAKRDKQAKLRATKAHASWVMFWRKIAENPDAAFAGDRAENTAWNLWQAVERSGKQSRATGWDRRLIEEQFGKAVADRLRETLMAAWRKDRPTLWSERPITEKNTFLVRWQFGLAGIAAEAEDSNWSERLTVEDAELASRYVPIELNGFPSWLESLVIKHPTIVDRVLGQELALSLQEIAHTSTYSILLQNISSASDTVMALFVPRIRAWLTEFAHAEVGSNSAQVGQNLRQAIEILLKGGNDADRHQIETIAVERLSRGLTVPFANVWLSALFQIDAAKGVELLEKGLKDGEPSETMQLFGDLFDHDRGGIAIDLRASSFTPSLMLRLLRLSYQHVRIEDDAYHEGPYSLSDRDRAEHGRRAVLNAFLSLSGPDGWRAKLEVAADPLFEHIRDRVIALAKERTAEEADGEILTESSFAVLDRTGESPPMTRDAMFALMRDRLGDIDDLLLQDVSPRELWATITDERVMRRELARALRASRNESYTVDQEAVTADEKETDIRFRSTASNQQGTIELKLADKRSGTDLFNTIRDQLLTKYMAADECRAGCLLVTNATERDWEHPTTKKKINFAELMTVLDDECKRLTHQLGGTVRLMAKGLDLRPRLLSRKPN